MTRDKNVFVKFLKKGFGTQMQAQNR